MRYNIEVTYSGSGDGQDGDIKSFNNRASVCEASFKLQAVSPQDGGVIDDTVVCSVKNTLSPAFTSPTAPTTGRPTCI